MSERFGRAISWSGLGVVNCVSSDDADRLDERLRLGGWHRLDLDGADVDSAETFFDQVATVLGGQPPPRNWESFTDSLRNHLAEVDARSVCLVWYQAHRMLDSGLADLLTAVDIITTRARAQYADGRDFVLFLVGDGANFSPLPD